MSIFKVDVQADIDPKKLIAAMGPEDLKRFICTKHNPKNLTREYK